MNDPFVGDLSIALSIDTHLNDPNLRVIHVRAEIDGFDPTGCVYSKSTTPPKESALVK